MNIPSGLLVCAHCGLAKELCDCLPQELKEPREDDTWKEEGSEYDE